MNNASFSRDEALSLSQLAFAAYWVGVPPPYSIPPQFPPVCTALASKGSYGQLLQCYLNELNTVVIATFYKARPEAAGFVALNRNGTTGYVAFTGTRDWSTLEVDLEMRMVPLLPSPTAMIASGFSQSFAGISDSLEDALKKLPASVRTVYFVGHSLGAAMATIAAYQAVRQEWLPPQVAPIVYTFASPRVGNAAFVQEYIQLLSSRPRAATWRVINGQDPVPRLPLYYQGYRHVPNGILLQPTGTCKVVTEADTPEWVILEPTSHYLGYYQQLLGILPAGSTCGTT